MPQTLGYREMERSSVELPGSQVVGWIANEELEASQSGKSFEVVPPGPWILDPNERYLINKWIKSDKPGWRVDPYTDQADVSLHIPIMSVRESQKLGQRSRNRLAEDLRAVRELGPPRESLMHKVWGPGSR